MAKFRRKTPVVWLPFAGDPQLAPLEDTTFIHFEHDVAGSIGANITTISPLTKDLPAENIEIVSGIDQNLAAFERSAYRLRRIVGKCFVNMLQDPNAGNVGVSALCTAGFIVLRVDPATGLAINPSAADYSPQLVGGEQDPWIWRRSWCLSNNHQTSEANWPETNTEYGSMADGPHIDQKTARRIADEERLFFVASTMVLSIIGAPVQNLMQVQWTLDYRLLATMLKQAGNRRNASR